MKISTLFSISAVKSLNSSKYRRYTCWYINSRIGEYSDNLIVYWRNKTNIHSAGISKNPNNNKVERFHNTFRERDKIVRGFQNNITAQEWADGFKLYYNYIKPHSTFNGLTPSEVAGIKLNLKENRWLGLLRLSIEKKNKLSVENVY